MAAAIDQAHDFLGGLNVAMNCAGILGAGRVLGRRPDAAGRFQGTVMVNLVGSFSVAKAAANRMQHNDAGEDGERGVIINTASIAAYEGQIGQAAYAASKERRGVDDAADGARAVALRHPRQHHRPGVFWTPMVDGMPEAVQQSLAASIPFPSRLGKPEDFASLVGFILGNTYLNGETIRLDGATRLAPK